MQLIYENEQFIIENNETSINIIFEKANEFIKEKDVVFSHLLVDNVEVYENHEHYLKENLNNIEKVEIATRSTKEMIWETMTSVNAYLERAIPALRELADGSYEKFTDKTWEGINQLAEGMQWILQFTTFTKNAPQQPSNWDQIEKSTKECELSFAKLIEGVEAKDIVLISDILTYEVTPAYEELQNNLAISLNDEEFLEDVN
ncbi:hypothetical protein [Virgibacillus doumboii]|uniref:hypothetical protein n=1 Tax=Virgibacillus doumboii TaxID=2697503 RepID=UPI0013DFE6EA|nr:hypothetical protein [Virgibacillus doumboii]